MKAVLCQTFGPPESLVVKEVPHAVPAPGEVVVRIAATALNFFDTLIIANKYQVKPDLPFSPGAEFAGIVTALGEGVRGFDVGDRVMGFSGYGAARQELAVSASKLICLPDNVSDDVAAGLTVTYGTTMHALKDRARLLPGETLAVLGASGGVGIAAVELGRAMGARVIACASSPDKLKFCRAHGADDVIDYSREDLKVRLKELTGGKGVDVIYDPIGGDLAEQALRGIAWQGRFLVIGFASGTIPKIPLNLALLKGCDIQGVFWGSFTERDPDGQRRNMETVLDYVAAGKIVPHVDSFYALEEIAVALNAIGRRKVMGKVVLRP